MTTHAAAIAEASARLRNAHIDDPHLEAEVLLAHVIGVSRSQLLAKLTDPLAETEIVACHSAIERRVRHEPLAYITGHREFYGIDIRCDARALIPRPETEMLVDIALEELRDRGDDLRIIDVGTGTGAIAVAITATSSEARVTAVDTSEGALTLAGENVVAQDMFARVTLEPGNLLEGAGVFDVILANLPYIPAADCAALPPEIRDWEPREALVGGERGTEAIETLLVTAPAHLAPLGVLALEIGAGQVESILATARRCFPRAEIHARKDLAGIERVVVVRAELSAASERARWLRTS